MRELRILNIDDNPLQFASLKTLIDSGEKYRITQVLHAESGESALRALKEGGIDLVFLDIIWDEQSPVADGIEILKAIRQSEAMRQYPVVMLTGHGNEEHQGTCLALGCDGFLIKKYDTLPDRLTTVEHVIGGALRMAKLRRDHMREGELWAEDPATQEEYSLAGASPLMKRLCERLIRICAVDKLPSVLLLGETGTGKSTIARMIHLLGPRAVGPFQEIVLNAIPEGLIEAELFGIERGVASGVDSRTGLIEDCNQGTLFLDEIGELPLAIQVKLLKALREKMIMRVGGKRPIQVDFNLISATNRDLMKSVSEGSFRLDLFQRIAGVQLEVPSLRSRLEDDHTELDRLIGYEMSKRAFRFVFTPEAKALMANHSWPANYAEFKTLIENLTLESTTLIDREMMAARLLLPANVQVEKDISISDALLVKNHRDAISLFKKAHMKYWLRKLGSVAKAAEALELDPSTIHRALAKSGGGAT